ncbi:hypothetical protein T11_5193 [Trichinella zimbabwensis]|uniref:Uncharacterized protein n=1 Tax=Trichinella zimbabwensis TaxID=268475 RepID=A0A0V1GV14_9BILA|nr:hypothetical protein T11_5193 [Trichinella zimbabwensis]
MDPGSESFLWNLPSTFQDISEIEDAPELSSDYQPTGSTCSSSDETMLFITNTKMARSVSRTNVIKLPPGPTRYAIARITDIRLSFTFFISSRI